ncbi:hypothetical protein Ddye_012876 [Dipteronia dyeriana]|uniref:Uncharacterized protein n=1 Tax=Dipteronia dyeriana TaxID=168575 RepID=A0AAE0CJ39_9ROSI|nr:hypothetical protein Ddye_012876 [Dipteronia dyeriana]
MSFMGIFLPASGVQSAPRLNSGTVSGYSGTGWVLWRRRALSCFNSDVKREPGLLEAQLPHLIPTPPGFPITEVAGTNLVRPEIFTFRLKKVVSRGPAAPVTPVVDVATSTVVVSTISYSVSTSTVAIPPLPFVLIPPRIDGRSLAPMTSMPTDILLINGFALINETYKYNVVVSHQMTSMRRRVENVEAKLEKFQSELARLETNGHIVVFRSNRHTLEKNIARDRVRELKSENQSLRNRVVSLETEVDSSFRDGYFYIAYQDAALVAWTIHVSGLRQSGAYHVLGYQGHTFIVVPWLPRYLVKVILVKPSTTLIFLSGRISSIDKVGKAREGKDLTGDVTTLTGEGQITSPPHSPQGTSCSLACPSPTNVGILKELGGIPVSAVPPPIIGLPSQSEDRSSSRQISLIVPPPFSDSALRVSTSAGPARSVANSVPISIRSHHRPSPSTTKLARIRGSPSHERSQAPASPTIASQSVPPLSPTMTSDRSSRVKRDPSLQVNVAMSQQVPALLEQINSTKVEHREVKKELAKLARGVIILNWAVDEVEATATKVKVDMERIQHA